MSAFVQNTLASNISKLKPNAMSLLTMNSIGSNVNNAQISGIPSYMTDVATSITSSTTALSDSFTEPIQSFEPVLNVPALSSFLLAFVLFSLLQLRINAIGNAVTERNEALKELRQITANQLSTDDNASQINELVSKARDRYRDALLNETKLRTIIPGVRIVAPNRPDASDENVAAAKYFLDMNLLSDDKEKVDEDLSKSWLLNSRANEKSSRKMEKEDSESDLFRGFSSFPIFIMASIVTSQILLLFVLSFDPMKSSDIFTSISGPPPSDLPFSSW